MDMNEIVDRITRDVVNTLKRREEKLGRSNPVSSSSSESLLLVVEEALTSSQWHNIFTILNIHPSQVYVLNLSSSQVPPEIAVKDVIYNYDNLISRVPHCSAVCYVAVSYYQLSALVNFMDNFKGVKAFMELSSSTCRPMLLNFTPNGYFAGALSKTISAIEALGIAVKASPILSPFSSSAMSVKSRTSSCSGESGECSGCGRCPSLIPEKVENVVKAGAERVSAGPLGGEAYNQELASQIDHTLLKADATRDEIIKLCEEARQYKFASVCVNPGFVKLAAECLRGSSVKVCTVIGFPLGATTSVTKSMETRDAVANGATEIDMVINVGALKAGSYDLVQKDIESVVAAAGGNIVKVILETALLTDEEKVVACKLSQKAGADFVKTSTGFGPSGATAKDVALMRETVGAYMGVKASGGIRDLSVAQEMIKAGATRIGASASVAIVKNQKSNSSY